MNASTTNPHNLLHIAKFFANQEIFITGGSGFIGKVLIEKILRSCPDVGNVYCLLRPKKGKDIDERLQELLSVPLFKRLRAESPQAFKKVHAIAGDCTQLNLGLSPEDLQKIQNVSIIYHSAASVRFDDPLREAILMNTRGTWELVKIAENLKKLKVFMHVSTTYCNPDQRIVEEKIYPPMADWRDTIKIAENYSTEMLNIMFAKYSGNQPNTYTFTKSLSEQIINDYKDKLPLVIFRPSIVVSTVSDPIPGWVDNFNGPIGLLVACGVGIMRTNYGDPDIISDFVPIDIVVRAMIVATCKKAMTKTNQLDVYNCATALIRPTTTGEIIETGKKIIKENPFEKTVWVPGGGITRCRIWNFIRVITLHIMMAVVIDSIFRLMNTKPFLLKLQRRIFAANLALHFFVTTSWVFRHENFLALHSLVPEGDIDTFGYIQLSTVDTADFIRSGIRGAKEYLLGEKPESSRNARIRFKIFQIIHVTVQLLIGLWILHAAWKYLPNKIAQFF